MPVNEILPLSRFVLGDDEIPLAALPARDHAVVRALRGWNKAERGGSLAMARLALSEVGLPDTLVIALATTLGVLDAFAVRGRPATETLDCPFLGDDERRLIEILDAVSARDDDESNRLLQPWATGPLARGMIRVSFEDLIRDFERGIGRPVAGMGPYTRW